jgi:chaperone modulatory protein CbpM
MERRDRSRKVAVFRTDTAMPIQEVCRAYGVERSLVVSMVEYGIVRLRQGELVDGNDLIRVSKAARLYRDLNVNVQGIAVILDLLDELESMRARVATLERTFNQG